VIRFKTEQMVERSAEDVWVYTWGRIVGALKTYAESGQPHPFLG
jgi:hypothetical protein